MDTLADFENLAAEVGIVLPDLLRSLLSTGKTVYGPDWPSTWRERSLNHPPPLSSSYDFEWLDAAESRRKIAEWLNPEAQNGRAFLPFAQSGAGDAYCLMPIDEESVGVALVWHDSNASKIDYRSFSNFVCVRFLETFADMSHLLDDFSEQEAFQAMKADVIQVTQFMNEDDRNYLALFCRSAPTYRQFRDGPTSRPQRVLSLISQEQRDTAVLKFPSPDIGPFPVVARWEISTSSVPVPIVDWRTYALDPKQKFAAIQSYQKEYGVSLAEAKTGIDRYIQRATEKN